MKFKDPMPIKCNRCNYEGEYKVDLLLTYEAKCDNCGSNFDSASDSMNGTVDELNETYELLQVVLGIEEHFGLEYKGRQVEEIKSIQDLLEVTQAEFTNQGYDKELIKEDLIIYLKNRYKTEINGFEAPILDALGIEIEKRKRR